MVSAISTKPAIQRFCIVAALALSMNACSTIWWCDEDKTKTGPSAEKSQDKASAPVSTSTPDTHQNIEFIAQLAPNASLESLQTAWAVLKPALSWIGPQNSGFLKIVIPSGQEKAVQVMALLKATKGVEEVEMNTESKTVYKAPETLR